MITRNHWLAAAMLAALICGVSFGEEAKVKTNDQRLLAWCHHPKATPETIETLLKAGADIGARNDRGTTPLMAAARTNTNPKVIETLLKAGANIEAKDKDGMTPLMGAAKFNSTPTIIETLLKAGADIEAKDKGGMTPLMGAARLNSTPPIIETLLKAGANAKAKDKDGKIALDYAKNNKKIYKTKVYWRLNQLQYE